MKTLAVVFERKWEEPDEIMGTIETPFIDVTIRMLRKDVSVTLGAKVEITEIN